jgi:hypothetical protein
LSWSKGFETGWHEKVGGTVLEWAGINSTGRAWIGVKRGRKGFGMGWHERVGGWVLALAAMKE